MAKVRLLHRAEADLEAAVHWYEQRSFRATRRFEDSVIAALERISAMPQMCALVDERHRVYPLRKSRNLIVYRFEPEADEVVVIAIAHGSREPKPWN